ncbi:MAG TPA: ATP-binding protein [Candidatus Limnocylindrales bacterium]
MRAQSARLTIRRGLALRNALTSRSTAAEIAVGQSVILVIGSAVALIAGAIDGSILERFLVALGAACLGILSVRRAPAIAWLSAIAASGTSATLWFDRAAGLVRDAAGLPPWILLAAVASVWAVGTMWIAARYATRPTTRLDPVAVPVAAVVTGWLIVGCVTTVGVVLAGQREPDPAFNWIDVATIPISVFLVLLLVQVALGAGADVRAAFDRARARPHLTPGTPAEQRWDLAIATAREMIPGQAATDEAVHEAERSRLASDLHAVVLPTLRRAIAAAEAGDDLDALARHLRAVDLELERLMADRWPVVLEAFGLVRALEDLAERLESDGAPPIAIDVVDGDEGVRQPPDVERAAWRFAEVTLDNAVRHALATSITVTVAAAPDRLRVRVADDGRGLASSDRPRRSGGRGLPDAQRRAAAVGATVDLAVNTGGGTAATFSWSSSRSV